MGLTLAAVGAAGSPGVGAQGRGDGGVLQRVGTYVQDYYGRAQNLLAEETVILQPLRSDLSPDGFPRRLTYEVRIEWDPTSSAPANMIRQLMRVNGRQPRERDEPQCIDPRASSPEPLAPLLPVNQPGYRFTHLGSGAIGGRRAAQLEFVQSPPKAPVVEWMEECAHVEVPGRTRTRIWADPETGEILRFDEHLLGWVDIPVPREQQRLSGPRVMTIERADTTIRYAPVAFEAPEERWMLPSRVESLVVIRNSGTPRMRIVQSFENYRRFVTESRILP